MPNSAIVSFNAGELSPLMDARLDIAKYRNGCRVMENFLPRKYGPAMRRPGTQFIGSLSALYRYPVLQDLTAAEIPTAPTSPSLTTATTSVSNATELQAMSGSNKYYLANDIDMTGESWTPITGFSGVLDGRGYTISNLTSSKPVVDNAANNSQALFGTLASGAEIYDLTLDSFTTAGNSNIAALAGYATGAIKIVNVTISNSTLTAIYKSGMLVGHFDSSEGSDIFECSVTGCTVNGNPSGYTQYVGGVFGWIDSLYGSARGTYVVDCYIDSSSSVTVPTTSGDDIGGFAGYLGGGRYTSDPDDPYMIVQNCYSKADVTFTAGAVDRCGGFIGFTGQNLYKLINCYSTGSILCESGVSDIQLLGGFIGKADGYTHINCYTTSSITSESTSADIDQLGGYCGLLGCDGYTHLLHCYATGNITLAGTNTIDSLIGGFAGLCSVVTDVGSTSDGGLGPLVERCWSTGDITSVSSQSLLAGGFIGGININSSDNFELVIQNCYAWGSITANGSVGSAFCGGFFAWTDNDGVASNIQFVNCYCAQTDTAIGSGYTNQIPSGANSHGFGARENAQSSTASFSYYDTETGLSTSTYAEGNITRWMQTKTNYQAVGWNFDTIWYIPDVSAEVRRLIPFEYSSTLSYVIGLSEYSALFFVDSGQLLDSGAPVTLTTPYAEDDLMTIHHSQSNDVMWLTHQTYAPRKLSRTTATSFSLDTITFTNGPFLIRNDLEYADSVTMTPSVTTVGSTGTLTLSATTNFSFQSTHVGALFKLTQPRVNTDTQGSVTTTGVIGSAIIVEGTATMTLHGTWTGTVKLERNYDGTNWETAKTFVSANDSRFSHTFNETEDNIQYRMNVTDYTSGTITGNITLDDSEQDGICKITGYTSATVVDMEVVKAFASTDATTRWAEGSWSDYRGWPKTFTFFGDRAIYACTPHEPQTLWLSKVGDYENFKAGVNPNDSFSVEINARQRNEIQWVAGVTVILIGTSGGEWVMRSSDTFSPVTPTNFSITQQSNYGSTNLQSLIVNDSVLFVDGAARRVREIIFREDQQQYDAPDLTVFCDHLTAGGITGLDVKRYPETVLWITTSEAPYLISLTNNRVQDILAGAKQQIGGSGIVESVAVIPSGGEEDQLWMVVKRTINSETVRYVELMRPWDYGTQPYAWFVDSGLMYDSSESSNPDSSVSGTTRTLYLYHLIGETVNILGDGVEYASQTVGSNGEITVLASLDVVIAGLPFDYDLQTMKIDSEYLGDTTRGSIKLITEVVGDFYETLGCLYGTDEDTYVVEWPRPTTMHPIELYTGPRTMILADGFSEDTTFRISGNSPYPCMVRSLTFRYNKEGR